MKAYSKQKADDTDSMESNTKYKTSWGSEIKSVYNEGDINKHDRSELGNPGEYPFCRGVYPRMYRQRLWTKRFLIGHQSVEEFNKRQKAMIASGSTGINFIPCSNSYMRGFDSDMVEKELVGVTGTPVDSLLDAEIAFNDIRLDKVSSAFNSPNPHVLIAMYFVLAQKQGVDLAQLQGTSNQSDFISHWISCQQMNRFPLSGHLRCMIDHAKFCSRYVPNWHPLSIVGQHMSEAGASAAQEIAFAFSTGKFYIRELIKAGLDIDEFAPRLSFFFNVRSQFFEEIAKFRAARRVWFRMMKEHFKAKNPRSLTFRFHVQTAGVALTAQQPLNNISRAAYHALSAVLGGAQSVHIDAYDEALCNPTELSSLTALRNNQILQLETKVTHTVDPLGGSYYVESLTNQLEVRIVALLEEIDQMGGIVKAVESGWIHKEISNSAYEFQQAIESGNLPIVGVNCHQTEDEKLPMDLFEVPETLHIQEKKLKRIKEERSDSQVRKALDNIARCCDKDENLMDVMVDSVKAYITEGEVSNTIKKSYGTWNPPLF